MSAKMTWAVQFRCRAEEYAALREAADQVVHRWRIMHVTLSGDDPDIEPIDCLGLAVTGEADDEGEEALERAKLLYAQCRAVAGLPEEEPHVVAWMPWSSRELYDDLSKEAVRLVAEGHYSLAVVRAQTACEVFAREAMTDMLNRRGGEHLAKKAVQGGGALTQVRMQVLLFVLTGRRIEAADWWADYRVHLARRHVVVHEGGHVDREAEASLRVTNAFRAYVESIWLEGSDTRATSFRLDRQRPAS